ncbi:pilus assembly protein [Antribacter sp. KLBMP9083]|uniref:Pilus assembly protein n=1 Tax=Antribacter soli TaxID=2910976 RepID=A0AA41QHU9_9MICO|nr:TadE/TadG family type IV pilus assembly protein [Antribacter soli]MCF4123709.1 pilus assembly protein [Antribacter soli]
MRRPTGWSHPDEGSASVEVAVLAPAFGLLLALALLAGRVVLAEQVVETAAWDAARTASIARDGDLTARAEQVAAASLANQDLACTSSRATVDVSGDPAQPGAASSVTVTVVCDVALWDLPLGVWGHTVSAQATSPRDQWRSVP